ncbi:hypothetical protein [uncultured Eubacterium sp.]|uniref:hypothetical protein n=1 Tax=uncultured Eubacterium sp. TaxID=165185 RepID=UPI0025F05372|nr:hypothetical protein [uncultured Eubacterium sp.]
MNNVDKFRNGKGLKPVTRMPNWLLKFKGKLDSKRGSTVADAYIDKLKRKCEAIENVEAITAEGILSDDRKRSSIAIYNIFEKQRFLDNKPEIKENTSAKTIRENRRTAGQISSAKSSIESGYTTLFNVYQNIVNIDTVLDERITKNRKKALEKVNVYISGVRSGKLKDYNADFEFLNDAYEIYKQKHSEDDERIRAIINSVHREV